MYDHLDDPDPPYPGADAREGVGARAKRLRRKRFAVVGGSGTAAVAVVVLAVALANGSGTPRATMIYTSPTLYAVVDTETPTATPTPSATPSPTPSATPTETTAPPTHPTPSVTSGCRDERGFPSCPDGKPGWSNGFTSCAVSTTVPSGPGTQTYLDGLTATFAVDPSVAAGETLNGTLTFSNSTADAIHLDYGAGSRQLEVQGGSRYGSDALVTEVLDIPAGTEKSVPLSVRTTTCGDTSSDPATALAAGSHAVGVSFTVRHIRSDPGAPSPEPTATVDDLPTSSATPDPDPTPTPTPLFQSATRDFGSTVTIT
jgi:hypothetical protein